MPRLRCAVESPSPGVVAVERSIDPPRFSGKTATVGALREPQEILKMLDALLGSG